MNYVLILYEAGSARLDFATEDQARDAFEYTAEGNLIAGKRPMSAALYGPEGFVNLWTDPLWWPDRGDETADPLAHMRNAHHVAMIKDVLANMQRFKPDPADEPRRAKLRAAYGAAVIALGGKL